MRDFPSTVPHPAADFSGDGFVAIESRSAVIGLSSSRVSLLGLAADHGVRAVLVTDGASALTAAFAEVWRDAGAAWVVRSNTGLRDGFTGRRLTDVAEVFAAKPGSSLDDLDPAFLLPARETAIHVMASITLRHRARSTTVLGGPAARLAEIVTGQPPQAWGVREPAGNRWDRTELTAFARQQMPGPIVMVGSGPGSSTTVTVQRTAEGVEEITQLHANLGSPDSGGVERVHRQVGTYLGDLTASAMPLVGLIMARPGGADLLIRPRMMLPPTPIMLLIGPPGVRRLNLDLSALIARFGARAVGRPQLPGLLFPFGSPDDEPWSRLDDIVAAIGRGRLEDVLGLSPQRIPSPLIPASEVA